MRFRCYLCHAKYSIPDEKLRNKILKIRCKRCGSILEVSEGMATAEEEGGLVDRLRTTTSSEPVDDPSPGPVPSAALPPAANPPARPGPPSPPRSATGSHPVVAPVTPPPIPDVPWFLGLHGKQEGPFSGPQLSQLLRRGEVEGRSLAWRDGMDGWVRVDLLPELAAWYALGRRSHTPPPAPGHPAPAAGAANRSTSRPLQPAASPPSRPQQAAAATPGAPSPAPKAAPSRPDHPAAHPVAAAPPGPTAASRSGARPAPPGVSPAPASAQRAATRPAPPAAPGRPAPPAAKGAPGRSPQAAPPVAPQRPAASAPAPPAPAPALGRTAARAEDSAAHRRPAPSAPVAAPLRPLASASAAEAAALFAALAEDDTTPSRPSPAELSEALRASAGVPAGPASPLAPPPGEAEGGEEAPTSVGPSPRSTPAVLVQPPPGVPVSRSGGLGDLPTMAALSPGRAGEPAGPALRGLIVPATLPLAGPELSLGSMVAEELGRQGGPLFPPPGSDEHRRAPSAELSVIVRLKKQNRHFFWLTAVGLPTLTVAAVVLVLFFRPTQDSLGGGRPGAAGALRGEAPAAALPGSTGPSSGGGAVGSAESLALIKRLRGGEATDPTGRPATASENGNGQAGRPGTSRGGSAGTATGTTARPRASAMAEVRSTADRTTDPAGDAAVQVQLGAQSVAVQLAQLEQGKGGVQLGGRLRGGEDDLPQQLGKAEISNVVRGNLRKITRCWERDLKRGGSTTNKVVLSFFIRPDGRTERLDISGTADQGYFNTCVTQIINSLHFSRFRGDAIPVTYPLMLTSSP